MDLLSFCLGREYEKSGKKGKQKIEVSYLIGIVIGLVILLSIFIIKSSQSPVELNLDIWK